MDLLLLWKRRASQARLSLSIKAQPLWLLFWSAKNYTGEEIAPIGIGPCGQTPRTIKTDDALGPHTSSSPNNTLETPGINYRWGGGVGQSVDFLLDMEATYSALTEVPDPLSSQSTSMMGLSG